VNDQRHAPAEIYRWNDQVPIVQEAGWAPGSVWTSAENLVPTGIRSTDRPARSSVAIPTELSGPQPISSKREKVNYSLYRSGVAQRVGLSYSSTLP